MPPVMVAGLPWSDVAYAGRVLRELGLDITRTTVIPAELDGFVARDGVLVWILADTKARLAVASRWRQHPRISKERLQVERDAMFEDWRTMVLDERPHLGYAFRLAHIVVHHDGDQRQLLKWLESLAQDLRDGLSFTPRQTKTITPGIYDLGVGEQRWEVRNYGHPLPQRQPYSSVR